jgi:hypothetical protein
MTGMFIGLAACALLLVAGVVLAVVRSHRGRK